MGFHTHEDFEDEGLAAFVESASDDFVAPQRSAWVCDDAEDDEFVSRPMSLRFAAEDADQLVVKVAAMRANARLFADDARAAMTPFLCAPAPEDADVLRGQIRVALETLDAAFESAVLLEQFAVAALREGDNEFRFDPEEARLELNPIPHAPSAKMTTECRTLQRQFFAKAAERGLITKTSVRVARLAAVAGFIGRVIDSTKDMTQAEWNSCVYAVEDGRLQW